MNYEWLVILWAVGIITIRFTVSHVHGKYSQQQDGSI